MRPPVHAQAREGLRGLRGLDGVPTERAAFDDLLRGGGPGGAARAQSHCRVVPPRIHFIPDSLTYSVPLFLNRQCDRTLGLPALPLRRPARLRGLRHRARAGAAAGGLHTGVHRQSEHGAVSLQKSGQLQPFVTVFPQGCMGQRASFGPT